jgi:hypothetical protein
LNIVADTMYFSEKVEEKNTWYAKQAPEATGTFKNSFSVSCFEK